MPSIPLWPKAASTISGSVDALYIVLLVITGGVTLLIFLTLTYFIFKYRHSKHPKAEQVEGSLPLEIAWSIIPLGIFMIFFAWGASIYLTEARPPKDALDVFVVAKQWMWKVEYPNGQREINSLHAVVGRPVRLTMISEDAIHSFFVPEFRIKTDVLPGRYTTTWFQATKAGTYHLFCAEYCGTGHSAMIGQIVVLEPADYQAWLQGGGEGSLAATGQKLFAQLGCATCHSGNTGRGPDLQGIYGKPVLLDDGRKVMANEDYLRESILQPGAKVQAGYQPIMPTFQGILTEEQLLALIAYVKSMSAPPAGASAGTTPAGWGAAAPAR